MTQSDSDLEQLQNAINNSLGSVFVAVCWERYPKETEVINTFVNRGVDLQTVANALNNKMGICLKSLWLLNYAKYKIHVREQTK